MGTKLSEVNGLRENDVAALGSMDAKSVEDVLSMDKTMLDLPPF